MTTPVAPSMNDVGFVFHNGRSFTLTEVAIDSVDKMIAEIGRTQERRLEAVTAQLRQNFVHEAFQLSSNEINEIRTIAHQNQVAVPNNRHGLPLVVIDNQLCPVRSCIYSPNYFSGMVHSFLHDVAVDRGHAFWQMVNENVGYDVLAEAGNRTAEHRLTITGTQVHQAVALFSISNGRVVSTRMAFHSLGSVAHSPDGSIQWEKLCTGNTPADEYWALPLSEFINAVNMVNLDSMSNRSTRFNGREIHLRDLIMAMQDIHVSHVRPEAEWRNDA